MQRIQVSNLHLICVIQFSAVFTCFYKILKSVENLIGLANILCDYD